MLTFTVVGLWTLRRLLVARVTARRPVRRAAAAADVLVELVAEELQAETMGLVAPSAEGAEGAPEDRVADVLEGVHVVGQALARLERPRILRIQSCPSRQGVHLPQDS